MQANLDLRQRFFSFKTLVSFLLAFLIIYLLLSRMDTTAVAATIRNTDPWLYLAAFVVYYLAFPLRGMRFQLMLRNNGLSAAAGELTRIVLISWFANCLVPAKLGDVFRGYLIKAKYEHSLAKTMGTIFAERIFDLFVLYLLIGASGLLAFQGKIPDTMIAVLSASFFILALILAALVFMKYLGNFMMNRFPEKVRGIYQRFAQGTMSSFSSNGKVAALTSVIWLLEGFSFYLVTTAVGLDLSLAAVIFIGLISALLTALPITPAGLGFVETAKVGVLVFFQVDSSVAVSAALLDRMINYWSLLLVGFMVYMASEQTKTIREGLAYQSDDCDSHVQ